MALLATKCFEYATIISQCSVKLGMNMRARTHVSEVARGVDACAWHSSIRGTFNSLRDTLITSLTDLPSKPSSLM